MLRLQPLRRRRAPVLSAVFALLASCAGGIDDPDRFPPPSCPIRDFDARADLLVARCGGAGCHAGDTPASGLDLVSPGVATRLLGTPSTCQGLPLVDTSSPSVSILLDKVGPVPRCGSSMPLGQAPLDATERGCLEAWVRDIARGGAS